jgi:hypothetical protein
MRSRQLPSRRADGSIGRPIGERCPDDDTRVVVTEVAQSSPQQRGEVRLQTTKGFAGVERFRAQEERFTKFGRN